MFPDYDVQTLMTFSNESVDGKFRREFYATRTETQPATPRKRLAPSLNAELIRAANLLKASRYFRMA